MMNSMTAYATVEKTVDTLSVSIEMRSLNSRHLDLVLKMPYHLGSFEDRIKKILAGRLDRGRVETILKIVDDGESHISCELDEARAEALHHAVNRLKEQYAWDIHMSIDFLTVPSGPIRTVHEAVDIEKYWPSIEACLQTALVELVAMRKAEGDHVAHDISMRLGMIEKQLEKIREGVHGLLPLYQARLKERVDALAGGLVEIDPARLSQEAAFLADRSDISEEIVRAESHIKQFRGIMASPDPAGRKLNFLLQEFNREFNTMGSKAGNAEIAHTIVTVKAEIEKIREQVQNIE